MGALQMDVRAQFCDPAFITDEMDLFDWERGIPKKVSVPIDMNKGVSRPKHDATLPTAMSPVVASAPSRALPITESRTAWSNSE
jgi:hypothetical protein